MLPSCSNVTLSNLQTYAHINETIHVLTCCVLPFQSISTIHTFTLNMFTVFFKQVLWYFSYILLHVDYNSCMLPTYEYFTFSAVHSFGSDSSFTHIEPRWQLLMLWMILCDHRTPIMFFFFGFVFVLEWTFNIIYSAVSIFGSFCWDYYGVTSHKIICFLSTWTCISL